MVDGKVKDVILLWLISFGNAMYSLWPILLIYMSGYHYHFHPEYSMKDFFNITLFMFLGIPLTEIFLSKMLFLFGLKNSLYFLALLNFWNSLFFYLPNNYF